MPTLPPIVFGQHHVVRTFIARKIDDRIELETTPGAMPPMRWILSGVNPRAFHWTNELHENGAWRVQQSFAATR